MLKNLMCKLNLGHAWHVEHNEDGSRYRPCTRCGKYDDGGDPGGGRWAVPDIGCGARLPLPQPSRIEHQIGGDEPTTLLTKRVVCLRRERQRPHRQCGSGWRGAGYGRFKRTF